MKPCYLIIILICAGCRLQEHRTTIVEKHVFSQEDSAFYFSDCDIKSRDDSFNLALLGKEMKFYNASNLSKSNTDEIRLLYERSFYEPYLISLRRDGTITIATIDTANYELYERAEEYDSLAFSPKERAVLRVNRTLRNYINHEKFDSAAILKAAYGGLVDSLYYWYLRRLEFRQLKNDTIDIKTTTFYINPNFFAEVLARLDAVNFWQMPVYKPGAMSDGSSWTLEVKAGKKHHISSQGNTFKGPFENVCKMLLNYVNIPEKYID